MKTPRRTRFAVTSLLLVMIVSPAIGHAQQERIWIPGWQSTTPMSVARAGGAIIEHQGILYAIGGIDGKSFLASTEYSKVSDDGQLGRWQAGSALNEARGFFDAVVHNHTVYAIGGGNGPSGHNLLRSVERASILPDGVLGPWIKERNLLNLPRRCVKVVVVGERLYALGGYGGTLLDNIESAALNPDGTVGEWRIEEDTFALPRYVHAAKHLDKGVLVVGGHNERQGVGMGETEFAAIGATTRALKWQPAASLKTGRYALSLMHWNNYVYALGGLGGVDYLDVVEKAALDTDGRPLEWKATTPLTSSRANFGVVVYKDRMYVLGGTNGMGYYNTVDVAELNERGDPGYWATKEEAHQFDKQRISMPARPAVAVPQGLAGTVAETIDTDHYSYLRVSADGSQEWLATARGPFRVGDSVRYGEGIMMVDFFSQTLQRTFPSIRFVGRVTVEGAAPPEPPH
jgi:hypothetical protein